MVNITIRLWQYAFSKHNLLFLNNKKVGIVFALFIPEPKN